ncbi:MAG TPA: hypothetical protein VKV73_24535 [Chloroflexota bacterium]|nr:hypothetical protein [Chloroflexota bacterium]
MAHKIRSSLTGVSGDTQGDDALPYTTRANGRGNQPCRAIARIFVSALAVIAVLVGPTLTANAAGLPSNAKWAIVLCKFADKPADPVAVNGLTTNGVTTAGAVINRAWISTFFTEAGKGKGGMFDYFAQVSNGLESLSGTTVFPTTSITNDDWYQLPLLPSGEGTLSWYTSQAGQARFPIWTDCVNTAVSQGANFTGFYGVLVVTNGAHDDSALGTGQTCATPTPNNGPKITAACVVINFHNLYVRDTGHEMSHGYGLQHSRDTWDCNPPNGDYCDPYDLMSANNVKSFPGPLGITSDSHEVAPSGPALNGPNLDSLGWLPANRKCQYTPGQWQRFTVAPLESAQDPGCLMVTIPINSNTYDTIEYRRKRGVDAGLNADIVLIHRVGSDGRSYLVDSGTLFNSPIRINPEWQQGQEYWDPSGAAVIQVVRTAEEATVDVRPAVATPPRMPLNPRFGLEGISTNGLPGFIDFWWDSSYNPDHFEILVSAVFTNTSTNQQTSMGSNLYEVSGTQRMFELSDEAITSSTTWTFQVQACQSAGMCSGFTPPVFSTFPAGGGGGGGENVPGGSHQSNWYTQQ